MRRANPTRSWASTTPCAENTEDQKDPALEAVLKLRGTRRSATCLFGPSDVQVSGTPEPEDANAALGRRRARASTACAPPKEEPQQAASIDMSAFNDLKDMISSLDNKIEELLSKSKEHGILLQRAAVAPCYSAGLQKQQVAGFDSDVVDTIDTLNTPSASRHGSKEPKTSPKAVSNKYKGAINFGNVMKMGDRRPSTGSSSAGSLSSSNDDEGQHARIKCETMFTSDASQVASVPVVPTADSVANSETLIRQLSGKSSQSPGIPRKGSRQSETTGASQISPPWQSSHSVGMMARRPASDRRTSKVSVMSSSALLAMNSVLSSVAQRNHTLQFLWRLLEEPELVEHGVTFLLCLNLFVFASVCHPFLVLTDAWPSDSITPRIVELIIDTLFFVELLVRFIASPSYNREFLCTPYNLLDIAAVLPSLGFRIADMVLWNVEGKRNDAIENYLLCVVPVLRLLKLVRRFETFLLMTKAFKIAFQALPVMMFTLIVIILAFSSVLYLVEPRDNIPTVGIAMYVAVMTLTTVGYGDVAPVSSVGQAAMCLLSIVSTLYLAIPLGIIGNEFSTVWLDRDRVLLAQRTRMRLRDMNLTAKDVPALFLFFDRDHDGVLSLSEFQHMISTMNIALGKQRTNDLFTLLDRSGDGHVSDDEFVKTVFPGLYGMIYGKREDNAAP